MNSGGDDDRRAFFSAHLHAKSGDAGCRGPLVEWPDICLSFHPLLLLDWTHAAWQQRERVPTLIHSSCSVVVRPLNVVLKVVGARPSAPGPWNKGMIVAATDERIIMLKYRVFAEKGHIITTAVAIKQPW